MRLYNCCIHHSLSRLTYFLESCKQIFELMMHCTRYAKYTHAHKNRNKIEELYKNSWQCMLNSVQCHKIIVIVISEHQTRIQNRQIYMQLIFVKNKKNRCHTEDNTGKATRRLHYNAMHNIQRIYVFTHTYSILFSYSKIKNQDQKCYIKWQINVTIRQINFISS